MKNVWHFDPGYTTVEFVVRNLWYNVRGRFKTVSGVIVLDDDDISRSTVSATIRADSVDTGNKQRDAHLLLRDFFDAEKFPEIVFQSTRVQRGRDRDSLDVEGQLTIKDKTAKVALAVNEMDRSRSPRGEEFVYYSATTTLDRFAFDISYARGLIGRQLQVNLNVQACKAAADASLSA